MNGRRGCFQEIWNSSNTRNARWNFEISALLQGDIIYLVFLVKIQNDPIRTEGGVAFQRNLEFQVDLKFWICYMVALYT